MKRLAYLLFPLAALLNSFSMTALLLIVGLAGRSEIAADIAIVQGASLALFFAFSANARNVVLAAGNDSGPAVASGLVLTRLVLLIPLATATFFMGVNFGGAVATLALTLIARRASEWLGEIALARHEVMGHNNVAAGVVAAEGVSLAICIAGTLFGTTDLSVSALPWALVPLLSLSGAGFSVRVPRVNLHALMPHFGSTAIIGVSVFVFRLSVTVLVGKAVAGTLFTAFTIGGLAPTVFGQALAPTLIHRFGQKRTPTLLAMLPGVMIFAGALIVFASLRYPQMIPGYQSALFWLATGLSIIGGAVMSVAMSLRTRLIHKGDGRDVFGPDLLANVLLTSCVPFAYHAFGPNAFAGLYLFGACLSLFFLWETCNQREVPRGYLGTMLSVIAVFLTAPLFFQLDGGLFSNPAFVFNTDGVLLRVPLPISLIAVFFGIALLGNYRAASRGLAVLLFSALLFVASSLFAAKGNADYEGAKLALLAQYLLPMFGLVLGEMYGALAVRNPVFERGACWVLVIILPSQLISTWVQGYVLLSPKIVFFSIYQHLQYFPMIVSALSILAILSLWGLSKRTSFLVGWLLIISSAYVVATKSMGAIVGLMFVWAGFAFLHCRTAKLRNQSIALLASAIVGTLLFTAVISSGWFSGTEATTVEIREQMSWSGKWLGILGDGAQPVPRHIDYWQYYVAEILESPRTFTVGHPTPPDRRQYPSAHNYWLDVAYNFGLLALLPVLAMLTWTVRMLWSRRNLIVEEPLVLATGLAFIYLFFVENTLKVGLRQPYPGILSYFIWGLLIFRLRSLPVPKGSQEEAAT